MYIPGIEKLLFILKNNAQDCNDVQNGTSTVNKETTNR